ncbi:MAG: bifunctional (p)ppGpp synthetase/guanosine-3',5'-bis(diphosphate) 3'-pyrophosphohydrolase [Prevotella sp.]|nr:bifunctional (p)ppGpp synthetase/guanosine-3',5'-bis(diphosphate) 3'-pyrophosphohydrolase [Prevotella sp.]MBR3414328.1 bifunctional (p)ppGpp synthetase/guanosine-3',5'-bis(diphosphate) 3'-pyrophosphohydrolase [Bacteroidales bacterium]
MDDEMMRRDAADDKMITEAYDRLIDSYMHSCHRKKVDIIAKAYNFARQAHKGVRRLSGEPYIMHPIAVAQIVSEEIGLGSTSICSALLHDVVEDTEYTVEDIENMFGPKVAQIVDGLTKISGGIFGEQASAQAENFKKLLLTMSEDIRVILIKIADRLHNMRTLESQPANKQYKIAGETLYLYAPLAHRLGLYRIKSELENLSFRFEHPEEYAAIQRRLEETKISRQESFDQFTKPIEKALEDMGLKYQIKQRVKTPYSIWSKMQNKHVTFDEIYDILAARIIFTPSSREAEANECFDIYVALTKIYRSHPDRIRDWVNHPKANGYQALHVTLMSKQGHWIEVQIRSERMNEIAEQGLAAHWKYKEGMESHEDMEFQEDDGELNQWLLTIKEILDDPQPDAMDFLDAIKLNLFASEIFVFTPKGEIKTMPTGCTVLDFAFSIHTFLGSHCIGAKVNHKLVPLSHQLNSGDQVEILTSKSQHVQPAWINFAHTAKAKAKVQAQLKRAQREVQKKGETMFMEWLAAKGFEPTQSNIDQLTSFHSCENRDALFLAIGDKKVILGEKDEDELKGKNKKGDGAGGGWRKYVPFVKAKKQEEEKQPELFIVPEKFNRKKPIFINEENITQYIFPECCHPIPGDDALGYIDKQNRIEIHNRKCPVANKLKANYGNRLLDVKWDMHKLLFFNATIRLGGIDRRGMINDVTLIISNQLSVDIRGLAFTTKDGIFEGTIDLRVHDREDVKAIMDKLKKVDGLKEISQIM